MTFILEISSMAIVGIGVGVVVLVVIVAVMMKGKGGAEQKAASSPTLPPVGQTSANNLPSMIAPVQREEPGRNVITKEQVQPKPATLPPQPSAGPATGDGQVVSTSGRVIQVPTELSAGEPSHRDLAPLEPSATAEVPSLAEATLEPSLDEMKIGTDEMPRMATQEVMRVGTAEMQAPPAKPRYRTPQAQALQQAIETMACPKCAKPTFVGVETPEDDAGMMFKLEGRCGACGHKAQVIDMRAGA